MIIIFSFSNQKANESSKLSDGLIMDTVKIIEKITHKTYNDEEILNKFVKPVRKMAHATIYFILGILVLNLLMELKLKKTICLSILICILYAISDEFHQIFVPGRSGQVLDVLIDTVGSFIGIILFKKVRGIKNEKNI